MCVPGGRQIRFNLAAKLSPKTSPDIRFEFGQEARSGTNILSDGTDHLFTEDLPLKLTYCCCSSAFKAS